MLGERRCIGSRIWRSGLWDARSYPAPLRRWRGRAAINASRMTGVSGPCSPGIQDKRDKSAEAVAKHIEAQAG